MAFGLTTVGCKKAPKPKTQEEVAAGLMKEANEAFEAGDLDAAEAKVKEAQAAFSGVEGVQELSDKIAAEREKIAEKARVDAILKEAGALLAAKKYDEAIEKATEAGDNAEAKKIIDDAKMGKLAGVGKTQQKAKYTAQNAKVDAAIGAGRFSDAIREIRTLEGLSGAGIGPSRLPEIPKLESKDLLARAKRERNIDQAISLAEQAVRKDRTNTEASRFLREKKREKEKGGEKERLTRRYNDLMRRAQSSLTRDPRGTLRMCDELNRLARQIGRSTREVDDLARKAREQTEYQTAFDQAKRYLQRGELEQALRSAQEARRRKYTREVVNLIKTIQGQIDVKAGDALMLEGKCAEALQRYKSAHDAGLPVDDKVAAAQKCVDRKKAAARLAFFKAEREAGRFMGIKKELADFVKQFSDSKEAADLLKAGPTKGELKKAEAAAKKIYDAAAKRAKAVKPPTAYTRIIEVWEAVLPDLAGKYEKSANKAISSAKDKMMSGKYKQVTGRKYKPGQDAQKIMDYEAALPQFKGTSFEKKLQGLISKAKTAKAAGIFKTESAKIKKATKIDAKIMAIQAAQQIPDFKGTKYEKTLSGMLTSAKTTKAGTAYKKVGADIKKLAGLKNADRRIARYEQALANPVFADTKFVDTINKSVKKERDAKAKVPFGKLTASVKKMKPEPKITALTAALGEATYAGTSYIDKMKADIKKTKEGLLAGKFAARKKKNANLRTAQLKIADWEGALPTYVGTKFEKTIKGSIQKLKDGLLATAYKKLVAEINKLPPLRQIDRLNSAQAEFASSKKYKASVDKLLKSKEAGLEKSIYGAIMKEAGKAKKPADKLRIYESRKGDLKTPAYRKKIDAEIKKLNAAITKAAQAAKDKQLAGAYKALTTKVGNKKLKSADKVTILETEQGKFAGSGYAKKIADQIAKFKKAIAGEAADAREAAAKKAYDAVVKKLVKAKKPADCDANIAKLEDLKFQVGKTSYAKKVDGLIKKERATKKKFAPKK